MSMLSVINKVPVIKEEPRYTLADIRALATEYAEQYHTADSPLEIHLMLSRFLAWLAKREQGKEAVSGG